PRDFVSGTVIGARRGEHLERLCLSAVRACVFQDQSPYPRPRSSSIAIGKQLDAHVNHHLPLALERLECLEDQQARINGPQYVVIGHIVTANNPLLYVPEATSGLAKIL